MARSPHRFDIWLVDLNPVRGSEIAKTRPCVVVSPDELNRHLKTHWLITEKELCDDGIGFQKLCLWASLFIGDLEAL